MNVVEFTEYLVKELVTKPDLVTIKEFDEGEENIYQLKIIID